jgi:hypothetical protein
MLFNSWYLLLPAKEIPKEAFHVCTDLTPVRIHRQSSYRDLRLRRLRVRFGLRKASLQQVGATSPPVAPAEFGLRIVECGMGVRLSRQGQLEISPAQRAGFIAQTKSVLTGRRKSIARFPSSLQDVIIFFTFTGDVVPG